MYTINFFIQNSKFISVLQSIWLNLYINRGRYVTRVCARIDVSRLAAGHAALQARGEPHAAKPRHVAYNLV